LDFDTMAKKKEKKCPLKHSEWVITLISDQNQALNRYYSTEMSIFTKTIIILTVLNILYMLLSILFKFDTPEYLMEVFFVIGCLLIVIFLVVLRRYFFRLSELKKIYDDVIEKEDKIIEKIIDGELVKSNEIREHYKKI